MEKVKRYNQQKRDNSREALRYYMKEVEAISKEKPLLTAEEEKELARRIHKGDEEAGKELVERNLRFVLKIAKKYKSSGIPYLDLINEGNLGLIQAAKRFDPSRNVRFISYAVWWIRQSILSLLHYQAHHLRIPPKASNILYRVARERAKEIGQDPLSIDELVNRTGYDKEKIESAVNLGRPPIFLDHEINSTDGSLLAKDSVGQMIVPSAQDLIIDEDFKKEVREAIKFLPEKEQFVLSSRFGLEDDTPQTLKQIGTKMNLSRERVRQLQEKAFERLRAQPAFRRLAEEIT